MEHSESRPSAGTNLNYSQLKCEHFLWGIEGYRIIAHTPWYEAPEGWSPEDAPDTQRTVDLKHVGNSSRSIRVYRQQCVRECKTHCLRRLDYFYAYNRNNGTIAWCDYGRHLNFSKIRIENLPWGMTVYRITAHEPWHESPEGWEPGTSTVHAALTKTSNPSRVMNVFIAQRVVNTHSG